MANTTNIQLPKKEEMTYNQRLLRSIIIDLRNELIGGWENSYLDGHEYPQNYTKQDAIDDLYGMVMNGSGRYLQSGIRNLAIERKHIRFMGEAFIRALIEDRVEADYHKNGWAFPNNYEGVNPRTEAINQLKSHQYYHFKDGSRERWFKIMAVHQTTVKMLELPQEKIYIYKLEGDVLKEMLEDKTGTCEDEWRK